MMLPLPWACMARTSCFMLRTTPRTLVSNVAAKLSAVCSVIGPTAPSVAALFTATSRRPNPATALSTRARTSFLLADIGVDELGLRTEGAQFLDERLARLVTPTGNDHLRALFGERDGGRAPDPGESTGDQDNLSAHSTILCWAAGT